MASRGFVVPPLVASNHAAVELCEAILEGTIEEFPDIFISEAVAVQIYRLVMDSGVRAASLKPTGLQGVHRILASLSRRALSPQHPTRQLCSVLEK